MVFVLVNYGIGWLYSCPVKSTKMGLLIKDEELPKYAKRSPNMMQEDIGKAIDNMVQYIGVLGERYKQWLLHNNYVGYMWFFSDHINWSKWQQDKQLAIKEAMMK